ncbi:Fe(2+)-trafficking protein [Candidatus Kinetoplastibacterium blastocrithidii TCC012E]|uniref:Probable Fe(2+)-trafficking protein n=1 Tax=Candidatus Kinetoplastidibacterium blastocrithidiae TCC012E TaxID=1208922 RepID=M1LZZ5_9PROT|nr:oxidative damage protection protein [Candidatus Kinetoplastibacterium blastocrithidii]AFZ83888.1 Fe(2+) trafficking family protein [Candidatus Kinetoplastibacterium blastocrithidii (ex Strigomonas culicis)]AGF49631.1 Fe(2+)-trafficking protein [Candidatus Kinetoplastibacterium blastocrithidii TCC012E]
MSRTVNCVKLKKELVGLDELTYPGNIGKNIFNNISKEAWQEWIKIQTRLINENRLNLADQKSREFLRNKMEEFLFEDKNIEIDGYVPVSNY